MNHVTYLPAGIAAEIYSLPDSLDPDVRRQFERIAEMAWADGYNDGHVRGWQGGRASMAAEERHRDRAQLPGSPLVATGAEVALPRHRPVPRRGPANGSSATGPDGEPATITIEPHPLAPEAGDR